jgi:hypothetical protein
MILAIDAKADIGRRTTCEKSFACLATAAHLDAISLFDLRKREPAAMGAGSL